MLAISDLGGLPEGEEEEEACQRKRGKKKLVISQLASLYSSKKQTIESCLVPERGEGRKEEEEEHFYIELFAQMEESR